MSLRLALTFDRLAAERGPRVRAASHAAKPTFARAPLRVKLALALAGYRAGEGAGIERWGGFPPMREKCFESRATLQTRVDDLVERLAAAADSPAKSDLRPRPGAPTAED